MKFADVHKSVFWKPEFESHVLLSLVVCSRPGVNLETLDESGYLGVGLGRVPGRAESNKALECRLLP